MKVERTTDPTSDSAILEGRHIPNAGEFIRAIIPGVEGDAVPIIAVRDIPFERARELLSFGIYITIDDETCGRST